MCKKYRRKCKADAVSRNNECHAEPAYPGFFVKPGKAQEPAVKSTGSAWIARLSILSGPGYRAFLLLRT